MAAPIPAAPAWAWTSWKASPAEWIILIAIHGAKPPSSSVSAPMARLVI